MLELKFTQMQNKLSKALQCQYQGQYQLVNKAGKTTISQGKPIFKLGSQIKGLEE